MKKENLKKAVREGYAKIAKQNDSCCANASACSGNAPLADNISKKIGYTDKELESVPQGTKSLGCGNPIAIASLRKGEIVLDLGSGTGFDCFLAANKVGNNGRVIGVDMTPEMIEKARENAKKGKYKNVEFRLGEIENLPVADNSIDIIISNCVINLSTDKKRVFREAFRVLKPGGRFIISDIILLKHLPSAVKNSIEAHVGCLAGAIMKDEYLNAVRTAGFQEARIIDETSLSLLAESMINDPFAKSIIEKLKMPSEKIKEIFGSMISVKVYGLKP